MPNKNSLSFILNPMSRKGIILLTLTGLFTLLSWGFLTPFTLDLYEAKKEAILLEEIEKEQEDPLIQKEKSFIQKKLSEGAFAKTKRGLTRLALMPFFFKVALAASFLLMLMLLREIPGTEKALWILPLFALFTLFTLPPSAPSAREALFPQESRFPKEAFSSKSAWDRAWQEYLDQEWEGKLSLFQLHLVKQAPFSQEKEKPLIGPLLTLFILSWTSYSAYQLNRRSAS